MELNNGIKKDFSSKDATRFWVNDDVKVQHFSHPLVSVLNDDKTNTMLAAAQYFIDCETIS